MEALKDELYREWGKDVDGKKTLVDKSDFSVRKGQRPMKMPEGYDFSV